MFKLLVIFITLASLADTAFAAPADYSYKYLECTGKISQKPSGMHEDYVYFGLKLIPFMSKRRDGTLVKSTGWNAYYGQTFAQLRNNMSKGTDSERWFTGTLKQNGEVVGREDLKLRIVLQQDEGDQLRGTFAREGTVVGDYFYNLSCITRK